MQPLRQLPTHCFDDFKIRKIDLPMLLAIVINTYFVIIIQLLFFSFTLWISPPSFIIIIISISSRIIVYQHQRLYYINSFNSSPPSATYMRQWIGSALVQIMALSATNFSKILIKIQNFSFTKMHLKIPSAKWWQFCPGRRWVNHAGAEAGIVREN